MSTLQWGGRFANAPDSQLLAFGSSLEEDLVLAPFDVECSRAHVAALLAGGILDELQATTLLGALQSVRGEIADGSFAEAARAGGFEDVHGAIDARVRARAGETGEWLHAGRSRNDQVATTLLLYVRDRRAGPRAARDANCKRDRERARANSKRNAPRGLHASPAGAAGDARFRAGCLGRTVRASDGALLGGAPRPRAAASPLGSAALAGSSLPLDRRCAADALALPRLRATRSMRSATAMRRSIWRTRSCAGDVDASRISEELIAWAAPAYGYVRWAMRRRPDRA